MVEKRENRDFAIFDFENFWGDPRSPHTHHTVKSNEAATPEGEKISGPEIRRAVYPAHGAPFGYPPKFRKFPKIRGFAPGTWEWNAT